MLPEPFCTGGRERWARTTSQPTSTSANPTPCTSFAADSEVPRAIDPASSTSGATAVSGTDAHRRATPRVTAPPSSPASQGSASTGPRASTGGSRVSQRFQPEHRPLGQVGEGLPGGQHPAHEVGAHRDRAAEQEVDGHEHDQRGDGEPLEHRPRGTR